MCDMISRQAAIEALWQSEVKFRPSQIAEVLRILQQLPSAQPEPSIPISWIEKQIDWLKSMDNEFSKITAMNISVLVKKWRKENEKDEQSD